MFDGLSELFGRPPKAPLGLSLPTGNFQVIGSSCHVRVRARRYAKQARMYVRVMWKDRLKARTDLTWQKNDEYTGLIALSEIDGVTPRDLLVETATIWVEDLYGRCGRLSLDGASQLSLARQYLDRDREVLQSIDFTASGNLQSFRHDGFSGSELGHTWTDGGVAEITFPSKVQPGERYELSMHCWPFLPATLASQGLTIDLNGYERSLFVDRNSSAFVNLRYENGDFTESNEVRIHLAISCPGCPGENGDSKDGRMLGFAFKQIIFSRLLSV